MQNNKNFSINIRRLRDAKGWTQLDLAVMAKVGKHTIFRAESKNRIPRGENITKIANALGVDESELFADPNKETKKPEAPKQEVDPLQALSKALAANGSIIIPLEEYEQLKANQIKSPELAEIIKMIDDFGDKRAYQKILRSMNISMENFALFFELVDPNKPKKTPSQESRPQTPQQETDKPLTPKRSG